MSAEPLNLLARIMEQAPEDDTRLRTYLAALEAELRKQAVAAEQQAELIQKFEAMHEALTAPANRSGVFLEYLPDGHALVAVSDTEYRVVIDPMLEDADFGPGDRILVNEAFHIVARMPPHAGGSLMSVAEVYEDGRLQVGSGAPGVEAGRIVWRANTLADDKIQVGDRVRVEPSGRVAVEWMPKQETRDYFYEEVPEIPWEQVGGQDEAIRLIRDTIEKPLLHPEIYARFDKKPIKGILLYGPPGCGKTLIGKATAHNLTKAYAEQVGHEVKEYFMAINGPKILNMWLGETERMVREIFRKAREQAKEGRLVFIFIDEAESILRTRSSGRIFQIANTVVPQFCAELDGLVALENVVLMLTSNRPDYIDPAVLRPGRIDRKVRVRRPDQDAARDILAIYLNANVPYDPDWLREHGDDPAQASAALADRVIEHLWRRASHQRFLEVMLRDGTQETLYWSDLVSGALLASIVDRAKELAIERAIADPQVMHGIRFEDLETALAREYGENEIFPKSDTQEDWLKLLDYEPEHVATVRPIRTRRGDDYARKTII